MPYGFWRLLTWKWLLPKVADLSPVQLQFSETEPQRVPCCRCRLLHRDVEVMFLTSRRSTFQAGNLFQHAKLRGNKLWLAIQLSHCQFTNNTLIIIQFVRKSWKNGENLHDSWSISMFFSIIHLPIFVFCSQVRMMLQNDHWIQPTFFPSGRIIWTKKHTTMAKKKQQHDTRRRGSVWSRQLTGSTRCLGPFLSILSHAALHGERHGARNQCGGQWAQHAYFGWWT